MPYFVWYIFMYSGIFEAGWKLAYLDSLCMLFINVTVPYILSWYCDVIYAITSQWARNVVHERDNIYLFSQYREAELKHARLAMLASVGWAVSELVHPNLAKLTGENQPKKHQVFSSCDTQTLQIA